MFPLGVCLEKVPGKMPPSVIPASTSSNGYKASKSASVPNVDPLWLVSCPSSLVSLAVKSIKATNCYNSSKFRCKVQCWVMIRQLTFVNDVVLIMGPSHVGHSSRAFSRWCTFVLAALPFVALLLFRRGGWQ